MPQYDYTLDALTPGTIQGQDFSTRSFVNPILPQISTATVGGTTDGTYTIQISGPEGTFEVSFAASGNTAAQIATGLAAAINSATSPNPLLGVASAVDSTADVVITFVNPGADYAVSFTADPSTLSTVALTQAAGGTVIPFGYGVYESATGFVALPVSSANAQAVIGVAVRSPFADVTNGDASTAAGYQPGQTVLVLTRGRVAVFSAFAGTSGDLAEWRYQNASGAFPLGSCGGSGYVDAQASSRAVCRYASDATAGTSAIVECNYPA